MDLRAADESNAGNSEAILIKRVLGRGDHLRVICQSEIVVCTHINDFFRVARWWNGCRDDRTLRGREDTLAFGQPSVFNLF